jgi:SNF2 family DNA or RNA helicase
VKVLCYDKPNRRKDPTFIASHDIVITSYEIATMEGPIYRKPGMKAKKGDDCVKALDKVKWFRIILDECQKIKTWNSKGAIACMSYSAPRRWCLSGTPLQNKSLELLSYYRFLRYAPFCSKTFFTNLIKQIEKGDADAGQVLSQSLAAISLRRTKGEINLVYCILFLFS